MPGGFHGKLSIGFVQTSGQFEMQKGRVQKGSNKQRHQAGANEGHMKYYSIFLY